MFMTKANVGTPAACLVREGTSDEDIFKEVWCSNQHFWPQSMQDWVVVDIGAYTGIYGTRCMSKGVGQLHSFEPNPDSYSLLKRQASNFPTRWATYNMAVVATNGPDYVHMTKPNVRNGRAYPDFADCLASPAVPPHETETVQVRAYQLNWFLGTLKATGVDLLKMDCEGAEWDILRWTELVGVKRLMLEYHGHGQPGRNIWDLVKMLEADGLLLTHQEAHIPLSEYGQNGNMLFERK
jgi:FkbM family methyltransferase